MGKTLQNFDQLTTAFKNNDQKVMQLVYQNVFPKFQNHVLKNSGSVALAKDVFQEAFVACWRNVKEDKLTPNNNLEGYLFAIAKNKWVDYLRSTDFRKTIKTADFSPLTEVVDDIHEEGSMLEQRHIVLKKALAQLGEQCKMLLSQFYFERRSMQEISKAMAIAPASARNQKYRCMEKLRMLSQQIKNNG